MKYIKTFEEFINEGFQGDNDDESDGLSGFRGGNSSTSITKEQDKHYDKLSELSSGKILGAIASTMSITDFNKLMRKVGSKLNVKGY